MDIADFMHHALRLALKGRGQVSPNPLVGCVVARNGHALPYLRLAQLFGASAARNGRQGLVVVSQGGLALGLVVDEILGASPTVVRPLGVLFRGVPGISGSTITRNGEVALILDVADLLRQVPDGMREAVA